MAPAIVLFVLVLFILVFIFYKRPKKKVVLPSNYKELLTAHVAYYNRLGKEDKRRFEDKIKEFLGYVRIDGIETTVTDLDKLLVASSAVIPIFGFNKWKYNNLRNVLLYPAAFNREEFLAAGYEKNTLGMVGNGPMQRVMILSKPALHYGFNPDSPKQNTGIHEFVHLLDKEDGDVDGLPETLLNRKFNKEWIDLVNKNTYEIVTGQSDIDYYASTNRAEFFAVSAEYFFNCPELFKKNHPDFFEMMKLIFNQKA
jgi:Mlc titration factor MtfA (ptsG expression regulator)